MERRKSPRVATQARAQLTVLDPPGPQEMVVLEELSGGGARIRAKSQLAVNTPVKLMVGDDLFLGDVCHCQKSGDGFLAGLKLDSALTGVSSLRTLMQALMRESGGGGSGRSHASQAEYDRNHQHGRQSR
jgi:hypothetical protein